MRAFLFLLIATAFGACSGSATKVAPQMSAPKESAGAALKRQFAELAAGQYGREWDELHPAQQALVSRGLFTECSARAGLPQIESVTVKQEYSDPLDLTSVPDKTGTA